MGGGNKFSTEPKTILVWKSTDCRSVGGQTSEMTSQMPTYGSFQLPVWSSSKSSL